MNLGDIYRHSNYRFSKLPDLEWGTLRWELNYAWRQTKAAFYQHLHVLAARAASRYPSNAEAIAKHHVQWCDMYGQHAAFDYHDPPDHMVVACLCGKEWS